MILKRKNIYKPFFKQLIKLRENVQNKNKILKFKKQKWKSFIFYYNKKLKKYKKFRPLDQTQYNVSKYPNKYTSVKKNFLNTLRSVQRFKLFYECLRNKIIKKIIKLVKKKKINRNLLKLNFALLKFFESRLDIVLYRSKFCQSVKIARQFILKNIIFVNNRLINNKYYILKKGDLITINSKYHSLIKSNILKSKIWPLPPKYLVINYKILQITILEIKQNNLFTNHNFNLNLDKIINLKFFL
uniref:Ribosomal protein S4 n=1 Tax=Amicula sp. isolate GU52X-4 cfCalB7 TaxID=3003489 RepID=A0A9E8Z1S5_9STRA|nr:ribosomal protein S4 [Amicula sp. isolate GU52X-4 cfCalB7]